MEKMKAHEFRAIRIKLNLNQQDFGEALGFSPKGATQRVSEIERGARPAMPARIKLARILAEQMENKPSIPVRLDRPQGTE